MKLKGIVSVPSDQSVKLNLVQSLPNPLHFLHSAPPCMLVTGQVERD